MDCNLYIYTHIGHWDHLAKKVTNHRIFFSSEKGVQLYGIERIDGRGRDKDFLRGKKIL